MGYIYKLFFTLLLLLGCLLNGQNIKVTKVQDVIRLLTNQFNSYRTYRCRFKEISRGRFLKGYLKYKKPHHLYLKYFDENSVPYTEIYVSPKKLYIYFIQMRIVCEENISKENQQHFKAANTSYKRLLMLYNFNFQEAKTPVTVLSENEIKKFRLTQNKSPRAFHFALTPKDVSIGLDYYNLWIDTRGFIRRSRSRTMDNRIVDIYFYDIEKNIDIPANEFLFEVPAKARVIKNSLLDNQKKN
ncbi:MAG TPA: hypothetical protein VKS21_05195 [Spirochaetota bacterium]|nr:hypothetical protein [Spirochaetota bacterium]